MEMLGYGASRIHSWDFFGAKMCFYSMGQDPEAERATLRLGGAADCTLWSWGKFPKGFSYAKEGSWDAVSLAIVKLRLFSPLARH